MQWTQRGFRHLRYCSKDAPSSRDLRRSQAKKGEVTLAIKISLCLRHRRSKPVRNWKEHIGGGKSQSQNPRAESRAGAHSEDQPEDSTFGSPPLPGVGVSGVPAAQASALLQLLTLTVLST